MDSSGSSYFLEKSSHISAPPHLYQTSHLVQGERQTAVDTVSHQERIRPRFLRKLLSELSSRIVDSVLCSASPLATTSPAQHERAPLQYAMRHPRRSRRYSRSRLAGEFNWGPVVDICRTTQIARFTHARSTSRRKALSFSLSLSLSHSRRARNRYRLEN